MHTLLLNAHFEPLKVIGPQRAMTLIALGKVDIIEESDRFINTPHRAIRLPSILRYKRSVKRRSMKMRLSKSNIYALYKERGCAYCGNPYEADDEFTIDHVLPRAAGGKTEWTNLVGACKWCNRNKADRTPEQARMPLRYQPAEPPMASNILIKARLTKMPDSWRPFFYVS